MRETDQGWLLDGGMAIANGHLGIARAEFNFDKQFVSYLLPGLLFKCFPRPFSGDTLVLAANLLGLVFFWGAMFWLLARSSQKLPLALALPVILAPAFLVYSPFYASAFTSAAFLIFLAIFLARKKWSWPLHGVSFGLAFLAVGARADAMLVLPLLALLHSPQRTFASVLKSPNTWLLAAGGLTAFFLGRGLYLAEVIDHAAFMFRLKYYLGLLSVGLGGAGLLLLVALHAIWRARRGNHCRRWLAFLGLGLVLPMVYYSFQMPSPRQCTVGVVSVLVFVCARRGRAIFHNYFRARFLGAAMKYGLLAAAVIPVFIGANLAEIHHPRITCTRPTLLPSASGVAPVGAYLAFAWEVRRQHGFLDHNQAVWMAAQATAFVAGKNGKVPYLSTPLASYLIFAIRLEDKTPERHSLGEHPPPPWLYLENRSLMRFQYVFPLLKGHMGDFFATTTLLPVAEPRWDGLAIFRAEFNRAGPVEVLSAGLWALNTAFGLDEFRLEPVASLQKIPADWAGRKLAIAGPADLAVAGGPAATSKTLAGAALGDWRVYEISPLRGGETIRLETAAPEKVFIGVGAFPEWMSSPKL
jgi:hypothetical protein